METEISVLIYIYVQVKSGNSINRQWTTINLDLVGFSTLEELLKLELKLNYHLMSSKIISHDRTKWHKKNILHFSLFLHITPHIVRTHTYSTCAVHPHTLILAYFFSFQCTDSRSQPYWITLIRHKGEKESEMVNEECGREQSKQSEKWGTVRERQDLDKDYSI